MIPDIHSESPLKDSIEKEIFTGDHEQAKELVSKMFSDVGSYSPENALTLINCVKSRKILGIYALREMIKLNSKSNEFSPSERFQYARTLLDIGKFVHGEKINTEALNLNVNADYNNWEMRKNEILKTVYDESNNRSSDKKQ